MSKEEAFLRGELAVLFFGIPAMLVMEIPIGFKVGVVLAAFGYVLWVTLSKRLVPKKDLFVLGSRPYWKFVWIRFALLVVCSVLFMYLTVPEKLFSVVKTNPGLWVGISIFYSLFSVYPQEFVYRSFFFKRYGFLFKNSWALIGINAIAFCLAHIGFKNGLVLGITLVGGVLFAITFTKTRSLLFTSIEHAIYGSWLFTVGMGEMLAFPMPE